MEQELVKKTEEENIALLALDNLDDKKKKKKSGATRQNDGFDDLGISDNESDQEQLRRGALLGD